MPESRRLSVGEITEAVKNAPERLIQQADARYEASISAVAGQLCETMPKRCLVLLSGPSASGKTTTAYKLQQQLRAHGREAYTVSLDNFYRGYGNAPQLPDGSYDYESIEALDLPSLRSCMRELLTEGHTHLPQFDFLTHAPKAERLAFGVPEESVVIFEGIHALNPLLRERLPSESLFKVFIDTTSSVWRDGEEWLTSRDLRLTRRLLRDARFRNSPPDNTLDMWRQVVRGEELYLFPYAGEADVTFDTTHAYEPAMLGGELLPLLREQSSKDRYAAPICRLIGRLSVFEPLSVDYLPSEALLREFVG